MPVECFTNRNEDPNGQEPAPVKRSRTVGQWVKDYLREPADGVYSEGKWKTAPIVVALVMIPVVCLNFHILGPLMGFSIACIYAAMYWIGLVFLHYSETRDKWLSRGMSSAELLLMAMMGINLFTLMIAETQWRAAIEADAAYEKQEKEYLASIAARDSEITGRKDYDLQIAIQQTETERLRAAGETEKTKQARWNAAALTEARKLAQTTGKAIGTPAPAPVATPTASPTPESKPTVKEAEIPIPVKPKWTAQECLVAWQLWIKIGQGAEFLICILGLGFLRFRSAANNRQVEEEWRPVGLSVAFLVLIQEALLTVERGKDSPSLPQDDSKMLKNALETSFEQKRAESAERGSLLRESVESEAVFVERAIPQSGSSRAAERVWNELIPSDFNGWPQGNAGWNLWNEIVESRALLCATSTAPADDNPSKISDGTDVKSSVESLVPECGIRVVGVGNYKIYPKNRDGALIGYDLRRIKPEAQEKKDVCFINVAKSIPFLASDATAQEQQIDLWIKEKEDKNSNLRQFPKKKAAGK